MSGKPYFRVGVAGLDPRDWRLIEIVFKHSQYNRFEFRLVQSCAPDAVDVLIVNSVEPEGLNTLAQMRSAGRNVPVISAVPRGAPNASRYAISIDRLTLQLLPILNRVVEAEILSPATRPMDVAPGSHPAPFAPGRVASPPGASLPVPPSAGGAPRPARNAGGPSTPADTAQPVSGGRPSAPASPQPGQSPGGRVPQGAGGAAAVPGSRTPAATPRPAPVPPGAGQAPSLPLPPASAAAPGREPVGTGRPAGPAAGGPGVQRPIASGAPALPPGAAARPAGGGTPAHGPAAPGRPFGDQQAPRAPQSPADPAAAPPRAGAAAQRPPGTRHASNLVAFPGGAQIGGQRLRVMVVDDSPTVRQQLSAAFERMGVICEAVGSAADAIERLDDQHYDLVLVDVVMPEMDGYRLTREIKKSKRHRSVPVIILTSRSSPFDLARGALAGCDTYLTKPVPLRALEAAVVKQLRKALAIDDLSGLIRTSSDAPPTRRGGTDGDTRPFPGPQSRNAQR